MRRKPSGGGSYNNNQHRRPQRYQQGGGNGEQRSQGGSYQHGRPRRNYGAAREKYLNQAREALAAGDRVQAENWFQHADHCYRMMVEEGQLRPNYTPPPQNGESGSADGSVGRIRAGRKHEPVTGVSRHRSRTTGGNTPGRSGGDSELGRAGRGVIHPRACRGGQFIFYQTPPFGGDNHSLNPSRQLSPVRHSLTSLAVIGPKPSGSSARMGIRRWSSLK